MVKCNKIKQLLILVLLLMQTHQINAQETAVEENTIYVNPKGLSQLIFTTAIKEYNFILPENHATYYEVSETMGKRLLTILVKDNNIPPTTLHVLETNGTKWNLKLLHKEGIDTETIYDFTVNTIPKVKNTILESTIDKLSLKNQEKSIPYSTPAELKQLKTAYPAVDFNNYPPEQTINAAETENNLLFNEKLYAKRPEINLAFKSDMAKVLVVCQNLIFSCNNAYIKLLIQNNGTEDFLTGSMILTVQRQNGHQFKLHPGYIFPSQLPVIKPRYQKAIIYSCKAYEIADEDILKFEIHDRLQKTNLEFTLKGSVYNDAGKK